MAELPAVLYAGKTESGRAAIQAQLALIGPATAPLAWHATPDSTVAALRSDPAVIVLLDQDLTGEATLALVRRLHDHGNPVVVLTRGIIEPAAILAFRRTAREAGADDTLTFERLDADQLERAIRAAHDRHRLHQADAPDAPPAEPMWSSGQQKASISRQRQLAAVVEAAGDAIISCGPDTTIRTWNRGARELYGYSAFEAIGRPLALLELPGAATMEPLVERARRGVTVAPTLAAHRHKGGARLDVAVTVAPLAEDGRGTGFALVARTSGERPASTEATAAEQLRPLLDSARDAVYQLDLRSGTFVYCSAAVADILGLPASELIQGGLEQIEEFVYADDRERRAAQLQALLADPLGRAVEMEYRFHTRHRSWRWVDESRRLLRDEQGQPIFAIGSWRDITATKQALETLRTSEQRYRRIIETTQEGVLMLELPWTITYINPRVGELLGHSKRAILGRSLFDLVAESHHDEIREHLALSEPSRREIPLRHRDGSLVWCIVDTTPLRNDEGVVTSAFSMLLDITERKKAEEELDRFFALSPNLLCIADLDGRIKRLNPAWEQTLGWPAAELLDTLFLALVHPEDHGEALGQIERLQQEGATIDLESRYRCRDGDYRWLAWKAAPDRARRVLYAVAHDVTDRKLVQAELMRSRAALQQAHDELEQRVHDRTHQLELAKDEAERANAAKSEFLSRMSHELRTPLNSILGFAQIMEMEGLSGKQGERVDYILKAGRHLLQLINEVLDLARVESGRLQISPEPVCVEHTAQRAVDLIRPMATARRQQLAFDWDPAQLTYVRADQQRLAQVLLNLLSNATKYTPEDGQIRVSCERGEPGRVRITVADSGPGISADDVQKLFQPFERLHAVYSDVEGTGLGLALSKRLVDAMDGAMGVDSAAGTGSRFWIELPLTESQLGQLDADLGVVAPTLEIQAQHALLYIEDNLANLQVIQHVLQGEPGITLLTASDGERGLALAQAYRPALILLDMHLPAMNGDEVLARLKDDPATSEIPVVMISADATPRRIRRLVEAGAADFLTKPLDIRLFLEVVSALLQRADNGAG